MKILMERGQDITDGDSANYSPGISRARQISLKQVNFFQPAGWNAIFSVSMIFQIQAKSLRVGIVGDSTVSEYPLTGRLRGWGQMLPGFFNSDAEFLNLAKTGASTKTFPPERWRQIIDFGPDFVLIEFGFNDQHLKTQPEATDAGTEFKDNLRRYVGEVREAGTAPILVTPNHRRTFASSHKLTCELEPYAEAMKEVGRELKVPVVDLYAKSARLYEALGEEGSTEFTVNKTDLADRPGLGDRTHFTLKGATEMARLVVEGLVEIEPRFKAACCA